MMKSFFKKLAFVMALAMVVSMVAPAGSAFAAEAGVSLQGTKTIVETYELDKVGATVDFSFQGAPSDWKTTFAWTSSNEAVATVDKAGVVTAVAAGTATITITAGADASYVHTVKVTVKEEKKADAFTVTQVNSDTVKLTFATKQNVTVDNLGFAMLIGDVYVSIPVKAVAVNENVATVTLFTKVVDEQVYQFAFNGEVVDFTASAGDIDHVSFTYFTGEDPTKNVGVAYVSTEEEPCEVQLVPVLYDANGVDVTSLYDLDELTVEFEAAVESDAYEMTSGETLCFDKVAAAIINLSVSWTDEETGDDIVKTFTGPVISENRPALKVTIDRAGFLSYGWMAEAERAAADFYANYYDYFWANWWNASTWYYGDWEDGLQFSALAHDNRGNKFAVGAEYPYGYFTFETSNLDVLHVTEDGDITITGEGNATVLIYFVDTTGEEPVTSFVGAQKITVYPQRYAATYKIASTSATDITDGLTGGSFKLTVYDQYGDAFELKNKAADITVEAIADTNEVEKLNVRWNNGAKRYEIQYDGSAFADMVGSATSKVFKYKVTVDKEANEMLTSAATATLSLKVVNTESAYNKLDAFLTPGVEEGVEEATKFYYSTYQNKTSINAYVNQVANFMAESDDTKDLNKSAVVGVDYLTAKNGYGLAEVPADQFELLEAKQTTGDAGIVYYEVTGPKTAYDADGNRLFWDYDVVEGMIVLSFNDVVAEGENAGFNYAVNGDYKVVFKTASKDAGTLSTLATHTIKVTNSQGEVTYNKYDEENGNKTTVALTEDITWNDTYKNTIIGLIRNNLEFKYNGTDVDMDTVQIWYAEVKAVDGRIRIDKVLFGVPVDDGDGSTNYYYKSWVTPKKWIYTEE